jgi:hypothetical protein
VFKHKTFLKFFRLAAAIEDEEEKEEEEKKKKKKKKKKKVRREDIPEIWRNNFWDEDELKDFILNRPEHEVKSRFNITLYASKTVQLTYSAAERAASSAQHCISSSLDPLRMERWKREW